METGVEGKAGVYVCRCGGEVSAGMDPSKLAEAARAHPGVALVREVDFLCSARELAAVSRDIKEAGLERLVVAACSPRLHGDTFGRAVESAGLNRYLMAIVDLRELCSPSAPATGVATARALLLVDAALKRVLHHQPLKPRDLPVNPDVLVLGGGIAGIQAAIDVASAGRKVYLVEKEACIGGHLLRLDRIFPTMDSAGNLLAAKVAALEREHVELLSLSEVTEVGGSPGAYRVLVQEKPRYVDAQKCDGCGLCLGACPGGPGKAIAMPSPRSLPNVPVIDAGRCPRFNGGDCRACQEACPRGAIDFSQQEHFTGLDVGSIIVAAGFRTYDAAALRQYGYGRLPDVLTSLEFERMCAAGLRLKDGRPPESIAIIHCAGSRDPRHLSYCSQACCAQSMKLARLARERSGAQVFELYLDLKLPGEMGEQFYNQALAEGVVFLRSRPAAVVAPEGPPSASGGLIVRFEDTLSGKQRRLPVDMVVLSTGMAPAGDSLALSRLFSLDLTPHGFLLCDSAAAGNGVFVAGCCHEPGGIAETMERASAAAAGALVFGARGKVRLEPRAATVSVDLCSGCRLCTGLCPYAAISFDSSKNAAQISVALCRGCGICVGACPSAAISQEQFTRQQLAAELEGVLA